MPSEGAVVGRFFLCFAGGLCRERADGVRCRVELDGLGEVRGGDGRGG